MSHAYPPNAALYYANSSLDVVARNELLDPEAAHCVPNGGTVPAVMLFPCCNGTSFDGESRTCQAVPPDGVCGRMRRFAGAWPVDTVSVSPPLFIQDELYADVAYDVGTACQPNRRGSVYVGLAPAGASVDSEPVVDDLALEQYHATVLQPTPPNQLQFAQPWNSVDATKFGLHGTARAAHAKAACT